VLVFAAAAPCVCAEPTPAPPKDTWATPLDLSGVPNAYRVSKTLCRSAQPTAEGMKNLKQQGIKTVVNLRSFHSDADELAGTDLKHHHLTMKAWHPEEKELVRFLQIVTDPKQTPVIVHCQHGADRTGLMCAVYRIAVEGWTKKAAIAEMTHERYGFHKIWTNIPPWVENLDIDKLRKQAGIKEPVATVVD